MLMAMELFDRSETRTDHIKCAQCASVSETLAKFAKHCYNTHGKQQAELDAEICLEIDCEKHPGKFLLTKLELEYVAPHGKDVAKS